jgi:hypothetical protein
MNSILNNDQSLIKSKNIFLKFLAMLFHRFGTMTHIIASTELCCSRRTIDKLSEEELMAQNAVEIARQNIALIKK